MLLEVAAKLSSQKGGRTLLIEIVGEEQTGGALATEMPEKSLLRNCLRNVAKRPCLGPGKRAALHFGVVAVPRALGLRQQRDETLLHSGDEAGRRFHHRLLRLVWLLAIELVPLTADWHQVHVHTSSSASCVRAEPLGDCPCAFPLTAGISQFGAVPGALRRRVSEFTPLSLSTASAQSPRGR